MTLRILSLGAGVQSSTIALMIGKGELPPVDYAIFADTQAEPAEVYDWFQWLKSQIPFVVHSVTAGNLMEDSLKLWKSKSGFSYLRTFAPLFVAMKRRTGMIQRKCTRDYKIAPIYKFVRESVGLKEIVKWRAVNLIKSQPPLVEMVIGISRDEWGRMKSAKQPWVKNVYPLVDAEMTRGDCLDWMKRNGYPTPPRSACIMCPLRSDAEWSKLPRHEIERAAEWEKRLQQQPNICDGDAKFIANAPTDIAALIAEVERVRAENEANVMARDAAIFKWKEALKLVEELEAKGSQLVESLDLVCMRYHESGELCWCRDACFVQGQSMADCRVANAAIKKWKEAQS